MLFVHLLLAGEKLSIYIRIGLIFFQTKKIQFLSNIFTWRIMVVEHECQQCKNNFTAQFISCSLDADLSKR